ncbi:transferrin-binding protein-like solute binding protein [Sinorhizobium meliloti]|uniref:transferrin-binding protein-like solute binding protein n=1 Tax=Rhizobium meliloti TaxID=382 RepID=UPI002D7820B6|nr:transferrin-binding protein-like solute binding protein [Sinorhizobium meliloti]WRQ67354.1 transferrin-binding protein-like solute binding protein [Sinorhizobium meliloti]
MNYSTTSNLVIWIAASLALAGCGGSAGGPGGPGATTSFTKFPLDKGKTATLKGTGREATVSEGSAVSAFASSPVEAELTKDPNSGDISSATLKTASTTKTWDHNNSELSYSQNGKLVIADAKDDSGSVGYADPEKNGFTYQTYGGWVDQKGGHAGAFSVGSETAKADIPTSSTATFKGTAGGIVGRPGAGYDVMSADAALDVDFGANTAQFSTSNTTLEAGGAAANLDMSGKLDIASGGLSGNIVTADQSMSGTADGHFYGSEGQEVGGTFDLKGSGGALVGGYGAVKQP